MKNFIFITIFILPTILFAQNDKTYYKSGKLKSESHKNSSGKVISYYFESGKLNGKSFYDNVGVLEDNYALNEKGDTTSKSEIPKFKAQPKKDLSFIKWEKSSTGIEYFVENKGDGKKLMDGDEIKVWYIGYFKDGGQFDNCEITGTILHIKLGDTKFLKSFLDGIKELNTNGSGYIKIPPKLAYGNKPAANIPPNSTLIYYVKIKK